MTISAVSNTTNTTTNATAAISPSNSTVSENEFLNLLVAQLQNQDPLNPADPTQFTSELAQFSSLEQLQNIGQDIQGLSSSQALMNNAQAVSYIGKQVKAQDGAIDLTNAQASSLTYHLDSAVSQVTADITDAQGSFVAAVNQTGLSAGDHTISWNGMNSQNEPAPDGAYTVTVETVDASGTTSTAPTYSVQTVDSVTYAGDGVHLEAGGHDYTLSDIETVQNPPTTSTN